jgi:DNA-binding PadR family transcriptional regulator
MMKPHDQRDLFPGALEMMILQALKRKALHGYTLAQHIKQTLTMRRKLKRARSILPCSPFTCS